MIIFEPPKCKLFLTFSALMKNSTPDPTGEILKLQEKIKEELRGIKNMPKIVDGNDKNEQNLPNFLYGKFDGNCCFVYQYPKYRLHFSIANYGNYLLNEKEIKFKNFDDKVKRIKKSDSYPKKIGIISSFKEDFIKKINNAEFGIKGFYLPDVIEKSIALKAYPVNTVDRNFLKTINDFSGSDLFIKAHGDYFAINIFRFICGKDNFFIADGNKLRHFLEDWDKYLSKNPIRFKISPKIVLSDPYLSNNNYSEVSALDHIK